MITTNRGLMEKHGSRTPDDMINKYQKSLDR